MKHTVVAFDTPAWTVPEAVLIDTSVVAEALLPSEPEHMICRVLLDRLAAEGTTVVFSRLLEIELWETVFNVALRSRYRRKQVRHIRYARPGRELAGGMLDHARNSWAGVLDNLSWMRMELADVADAVPDLIKSYGLQSYDAVHAATLLATGPRDLITRDNGFAVLLPEDATIHTTSARLASTRAKRQVTAR